MHKILDNFYIQKFLSNIYRRLRQADLRMNVLEVKRKYQIHPTVTWGRDTSLYGDGMIFIGESTYIGSNSFIVAHPTEVKIEIGKYCAISHNVNIRTYKYRTDIHFKDARSSPGVFSNIIINDYVWIGANVFICGGVNIGENSVIGANSVVTHDIPANSIYGGVPARLINVSTG